MTRHSRPNNQAQLDAFPSSTDLLPSPIYREEPLHHAPPDVAFRTLENMDWSFTQENTGFLGHDLHPYPAKFIPQLPGTFISLLSSRGELVFDPFGGSGTTALEAIRLGRRAISLDANPVAALIGRVKTARVTPTDTAELHQLHAALRAFLEPTPPDAKELIERYQAYAPTIANRSKWFADEAFGELAHIRFRIASLGTPTAQDVANLALSRSILAASFQDSETRYKSVPRNVMPGETTRRFVREFETAMRTVARNVAATRYGISTFLTGDVREIGNDLIPAESIDLVVTSPPYGNAMDYHLYHRFRLLWLGHDPIALGRVEIGSHLKHQRESTSFDSYFSDMCLATQSIERVLKPGRYAVFVIGNSMYGGQTFETAHLLANEASRLGFHAATVFDRPIHRTKRSFTPAARRAAVEHLLVLHKATRRTHVSFLKPPYRLWPYEEVLRDRELAWIRPQQTKSLGSQESIEFTPTDNHKAKTLVFTHHIVNESYREPTWQAILENGMASNPTSRKDPKYVTHGIHAYKGKFYPQLAKGLLNQGGLQHGATILDPFCGSGTTMLEGYLNGYSTYGCDLHPLAAYIASAKTSVLEVDPDVVTESVSAIIEALDSAPNRFPGSLSQFDPACHDEIERWFSLPIAHKLNWVLAQIRATSDGSVRAFLEVVLSSIVRDVSQQEPSDLRIRYRKNLLGDADVIGSFREQLAIQFSRVEKFWKVRGYAPHPFFRSNVIAGDNRLDETYARLGIGDGTIDLVLTSPPYAMALPYIDTDRLSLLLLFGLNGTLRRPLENSLIGSREISVGSRSALEETFLSGSSLPADAISFLRRLHSDIENSDDSGFRKRNMPALVYRFLHDMKEVLRHMVRLMKRGSEAMIVIGDSRMTIAGRDVRIPTTDLVESIAMAQGLQKQERLDISVTTENLLHIKNAITENVVLRLRK